MKFKKLLCLISVLAFSGNFLIVCDNSFGAGKPLTSVGDLKKKAEKFFNEEKYGEAIESYSQLLSLEPQSPDYNYHYGVCLLFAGRDKSQSISFLEVAAKSPTTKPEVHFYLGRSYMYANRYNEAIAKFEEYKKAMEKIVDDAEAEPVIIHGRAGQFPFDKKSGYRWSEI